MDFWQRVAVQDQTMTRTPTGNVRAVWADISGMESVEARVLPLVTDEQLQPWATPEEDAYEVHLRGAWSVRPRMRVMVDADAYDIRRVITPPPFGTPVTVLQTVLVTP